jgi:hypothetical protein
MMVQRSFGEAMNWKEARQPLGDFAVENCSHGAERVLSTVERMAKMKKVLALLNSPHEGEAMSAARMVMKLSQAWGINVNGLRGLSGELVDNLLEMVAKSQSGHSFLSNAAPDDHLSEVSDPEFRRRTIPTFVKAHLRRRRGGPPFPVRPHRRRRRARPSSSGQAGRACGKDRAQALR